MAWWITAPAQLVVHTSTQVPHLDPYRSRGMPRHSRGRSGGRAPPDAGGGVGYKCKLMPEEIVVAWLALERRSSYLRRIEDRREHLNCRRQCEVARIQARRPTPMSAGAWSLWPRRGIDGRLPAPIPCGRSRRASKLRMAGGNLPGPYDLEVLSLQDLFGCGPTSRLAPYWASRARRSLRHRTDDRCHCQGCRTRGVGSPR